MPRSSEQLRKIVNMLSDERQAPVALNMLRAEAEERRVLVADLMASLATPQPAPEPPAPTDSIDIAIGKRIDHARYGLQSEILAKRKRRGWCDRRLAAPMCGCRNRRPSTAAKTMSAAQSSF
jgi:hypothetical protein